MSPNSPRMPKKKKPFDIDAGARLKDARTALGISQKHFAASLGITPQKLSNWENGENGIPPDEVARIWEAHQISADWIYLRLMGNLGDKLATKLRELKVVEPAPIRKKAKTAH